MAYWFQCECGRHVTPVVAEALFLDRGSILACFLCFSTADKDNYVFPYLLLTPSVPYGIVLIFLKNSKECVGTP